MPESIIQFVTHHKLGTSLAMLALVGVVCLVGCPRGEQERIGPQSVSGLGGRTDKGEVLLGNAVNQLNDLSDYVQTDLAPPQVVLDSRSSSDGQDVLAKLTKPPQLDEELPVHNRLTVTTRNGRFRSVGVETGDIVKYYIDVDTEALASESKIFGTRPEMEAGGSGDGAQPAAEWNEGFVREKAVEFSVAQVIDDNTLILTPPLPVPISIPANVEVWRYSDDRMLEISRRLGRYVNRRLPAVAWEPTPDEHVLSQIVDRLNPWARQTAQDSSWQVDPLLETLPADLADAEELADYLSPQALARTSFTLQEVRTLQEAIWLRDISEWARGDSFDVPQRAAALFDWTIRHVQLDPDEQALPRHPWQVLLYGHGTAEQRAWIFAQLCRQQRMDVVVLSVPTADGEEEGDAFWLPALVHEGQLYLFDTRLGLPIPGPQDEAIATLQQLQEMPALLAALEVDGIPYRISSEQIDEVSAQVVASPFELSQRASLLDAKLSGDDRIEIAVDAASTAERVRQVGGVGDVRLWATPCRTLLEQLTIDQADRRDEAVEFQPFAWRPLLYKARVLHFQGRQEVQTDPRRGGWEEEVDSHQEAGQLYTDRRVRPPERVLDQLQSADKLDVYQTAKRSASYWLGLLKYDNRQFKAAEDWLLRRTLEDAPGGRWTAGARYNLARTYEQLGQPDEAIALYEADDSPQQHGNLLRARQLQQQASSDRGDGDAE